MDPEELMTWVYMRFKLEKSRSLVLKKGMVTDKFCFTLCNTKIPSIMKKLDGSLGKMFDISRLSPRRSRSPQWRALRGGSIGSYRSNWDYLEAWAASPYTCETTRWNSPSAVREEGQEISAPRWGTRIAWESASQQDVWDAAAGRLDKVVTSSTT